MVSYWEFLTFLLTTSQIFVNSFEFKNIVVYACHDTENFLVASKFKARGQNYRSNPVIIRFTDILFQNKQFIRQSGKWLNVKFYLFKWNEIKYKNYVQTLTFTHQRAVFCLAQKTVMVSGGQKCTKFLHCKIVTYSNFMTKNTIQN